MSNGSVACFAERPGNKTAETSVFRPCINEVMLQFGLFLFFDTIVAELKVKLGLGHLPQTA
jgi:hypothetical protein